MTIKTITSYLLLLFLCGGVALNVVMAQDNSELRSGTVEVQPFDKALWDKLNEELDYSGDAPEPQKTEEPEEQESNFEFPTLPPFLQILFLGALLVLLAWLIYSIVQADDGRKIKTNIKTAAAGAEKITLKRLEEELDKNDVFPLLFQAEQDKNYHLAVRLHFLGLLKKLHTNGNIQWKKDLTNSAYLRQMRSQPAFPDFQQLTATFERVWYGNQIPNAAEYDEIKRDFNAFKAEAQTVKPLAHE